MAERVFLDTNIFVYEFDPRDPGKQATARSLVAGAAQGSGVISYQVIQEFANVMTGRFAKPLSAAHLREYLSTILWPMCDVWPTPNLFDTAIRVRERAGWSFYDSLIVSAAILAECSTLFSEDLQVGRHYNGLEIRNPFAT